MSQHPSACTTVLVGKNAALEGSPMAGRNDDTFAPLNPQRLVVYPAYQNHPNQVKSYLNHFIGDRPANGYRYQGVPNVNLTTEGVYDENGFNEHQVGMSATESVYTNERALAFDPLNTESGLNEDVIVAMTLPFIDSAAAGVDYLGQLVAKYGSAEGNGVAFIDKDDVWYMEIVTGHHWVAQRIPDDAYAVTGNRIAIQDVDFADPANFKWSAGIQEFVTSHHLNPDPAGWNFRKIFATTTEFDQHYNTPRQWDGHRILSPDVKLDPLDFNLPFILRPAEKISLEQVEVVLGSHYQGTVYDPLGITGTAAERVAFRPVALSRTQNSHVLQVRSDLPENAQSIMWMSIGIPTFSPYLPFFGNLTAVPESYRETPQELSTDFKSAYWMYRGLSMLVEAHYAESLQDDLDYLKAARELFHRWVAETAAQTAGLDQPAAQQVINQATAALVDEMATRTKKLMAQLMMRGLELSKLTFKMDKNL